MKVSAGMSRVLCAPKAYVARLRGLLRSGDEGGALVELAVTLPLIMVIMTGVFSYSIAIYQKLQLAEAVSVGGRFLAVDRGDSDPCAQTVAKIAAAAPGLVSSNITYTFVINGHETDGTSCPGSGSGPNTDMVTGKYASVQASYPYTANVWSWTPSPTSITLTSGVVEVIQ